MLAAVAARGKTLPSATGRMPNCAAVMYMLSACAGAAAANPQQMDLGALLGGGGAGRGGGGGGRGEGPACPKGRSWVPKKNFMPQANGCGPAGMRQREGDVFRLHECCNGHDTCYASCGTPFNYCEKQFSRCMDKKCDAVPAGDKQKCLQLAKSFASMTQMFGSSFHESGMVESCECVPDADEPGKSEEYFVWFYKKYNADKLVERSDGSFAVKMGEKCSPADSAVTPASRCGEVALGSEDSRAQCESAGDSGGTCVYTPWEEKSVAELLAEKRTKKGGLGALWWKLMKQYPDHIAWVTDGEMGLSADQCVIV